MAYHHWPLSHLSYVSLRVQAPQNMISFWAPHLHVYETINEKVLGTAIVSAASKQQWVNLCLWIIHIKQLPKYYSDNTILVRALFSWIRYNYFVV